MVKKNYQAEINTKKKVAKVMGKNLPISLKFSAELAREIKNKPVEKTELFLDDIVALKRHLPLRVYNKKVAHRKGEAKSGVKSGRYPVNVAKTFKKLLESLKANADNLDMDSDKLKIMHVHVSQGFSRRSSQPQGKISGRGRDKKSTHVEIMAMEA